MRWNFDGVRPESSRSVGIASPVDFRHSSASCFPSWAVPRAATSVLLQEMCLCQARRGSGCVGKISFIVSIQLCLGSFNLIEKSQRHYSSPLGGAGPCYIFHGLVQSSSAVPWHSVVVPAMGPPGTKLLPALSLSAPHCPCSPSRGVGGKKEALWWHPPP